MTTDTNDHTGPRHLWRNIVWVATAIRGLWPVITVAVGVGTYAAGYVRAYRDQREALAVLQQRSAAIDGTITALARRLDDQDRRIEAATAEARSTGQAVRELSATMDRIEKRLKR